MMTVQSVDMKSCFKNSMRFVSDVIYPLQLYNGSHDGKKLAFGWKLQTDLEKTRLNAQT